MTLIAMIIVTGCTIAGSLLWGNEDSITNVIHSLINSFINSSSLCGYKMYQS